MDIDSKNNGVESYNIEDLKKIVKILSQDEFEVSIKMVFGEMRSSNMIRKIKEDITNRYKFTMSKFTIRPIFGNNFDVEIKFMSTDL